MKPVKSKTWFKHYFESIERERFAVNLLHMYFPTYDVYYVPLPDITGARTILGSTHGDIIINCDGTRFDIFYDGSNFLVEKNLSNKCEEATLMELIETIKNTEMH